MNDSQRHVFTNEFDDLCILISLDMEASASSMRVTISELDSVWDESVPVFTGSLVTRTLDEG
jgi:hypothetical protein